MKELARRVLTLSDLSAGLEIAPARSAEVVRFVANVDRMQQWLKLEPPRDPLAGLSELMN